MDLALSLVSGLIGAVIGGWVTFAAQRNAHDRDRRAAVRACMLELARNTATIQKTLSGQMAPPIVATVWDSHGPLVLSALSEAEADVVGPAYYMLPIAERIRQNADALGAAPSGTDAEYLRETATAAELAGHKLLAWLGKRRWLR